MREVTKAILALPVKEGETSNLEKLKDAETSNVTTEQAIILQQVSAALNGDTAAAKFIFDTLKQEDESCDKEMTKATADGGQLETLIALRDKLAKTIDLSSSSRDIAALSRQLTDVLERIADLDKSSSDKPKETPLNVIKLSREKRVAKATNTA